MKRCSKCKEEKPFEEFHKDKAMRDGVSSSCKSCRKEYQKKYYEENRDKELEYQKKYYEENRDKVAEYKKKYREENRDKELEYQKKYYEENRDKVAERQKKYQKKYREENRDKVAEYKKKYHEENRDKVAEYQKKYYEENRDKAAEYQKKYAQANPLKTRAYKQKRRALKLETEVEPIDLNLVWDDSFGICFLCGTPMDRQYTYPDPRFPSLEHVIPLSRGGTHTYDNLTYTHLQCNNRKLSSLVEEIQLPLDPPTCYTE